MDARHLIVKELLKINVQLTDDYDILIEGPCKSAGKKYDLMDANRNSKKERICIRTCNLDQIQVGTLENGSIIIFARK